MVHYIVAAILVWFLGIDRAAPVHRAPQSAFQSAGAATPDLQQVGAQTFLQHIQRLELVGKWGAPVDGLRMSILEDDEDEAELSNDPDLQEVPNHLKSCAELGGFFCGPGSFSPAPQSKKIQLLLEVRNDGDREIAIAMGGGCGTRATGVTSNVEVVLTDSDGTSYPLRFLGIGPPYQGGCAGGAASYRVTIGAGKSFAAVLDLGKYMNLSDNQSYSMHDLPAGAYSVQAQLELRSPSMPPSAPVKSFGTLTSNTIQVQFDSEFSILSFGKPKLPPKS